MLDGYCIIILPALLNKSRRKHPTKQQLYGCRPPISTNIKIRRTRLAGYCWRSKDELISDVLLWTPSHGRERFGWSARTYLQKLCSDTRSNLEDLARAMDDRDELQKSVREIHASDSLRWKKERKKRMEIYWKWRNKSIFRYLG